MGTLLVCAADGFSGEMTGVALIGGLAMALGVECGFLFFKTGDQAVRPR